MTEPTRPHPVVALVQARMGSSRLPGKVLLRAAGKTLLGHVIERLQAARIVDTVLVATTREPADDAVEAEALACGAGVYRGDRDDVLQRFEQASAQAKAAVVVRVTADCPLLDPSEIDRVVAAFLDRWPDLDYASNQLPGRVHGPLGMAVEVMQATALARADREARAPHEREHVTPFLYAPGSGMRAECFDFPENLSHLRLTVDTPVDFAVVAAVLEGIATAPDRLALGAALRFLAAHPDLARRNADVRQKDHREAATRHLLLRADATVDGGTGHVMRLLGIGEAWMAQGGAVTLVSHRLAAPLAERLQAAGVAVAGLPDGAVPGTAADVDSVQRLAAERSAELVLVDGYGFDRAFLRALASPSLQVAYVDDYATEVLPVAAVLLPNLGQVPAPPEAWQAVPLTLAGASYIPVRKDFRLAPRPQRRFDQRPLRLLVTFGGSDPARMSVRALRAALEVAREIPLVVAVVLGPVHPDVEQVRRLAAEAATSEVDITIEILHNVMDMPALFGRTDLALSAGGTTCWELATLGIPMLLCPVADNQRVVLDGLGASGAAWILPPATILNDAGLAASLLRFVGAGTAVHEALSQAGMALIDGQGALRIARELATLTAGVPRT